MQVGKVVNRLTEISEALQRYVPADGALADLLVANENGTFEFSVDMRDSLDMAEKYRDMLVAAFIADGVQWTMTETGRRRDDATGTFVFTTDKFVLSIVNFSQWAHMLGQTPGPTDSGDPEIERFMNESEAGTTSDA